jgi:hypothetical protein
MKNPRRPMRLRLIRASIAGLATVGFWQSVQVFVAWKFVPISDWNVLERAVLLAMILLACAISLIDDWLQEIGE